MGLKKLLDSKLEKIVNYLLQGIIGLIFTIILGYVFTTVAPYSGLLLPMGFGQGPGQANNIGGIFEANGFVGGQAFGLAISTIGFIWGSVAGIFINRRRAKRV